MKTILVTEGAGIPGTSQEENSNDSSSAASTKPHLAWLDALRALAALWVVVHHALLTINYVPEGTFQNLVHKFFMKGRLPVVAFIALSGFSLALQTRSRGWRLRNGYSEFLVSRAIRIVPPYYASIVLSLLLIATLIGQKTGTHWDVSIPVTAKGILDHFLMIQNIQGGPQINHVYWSVGVESQIYLFFAWILWSLRRFGLVGVFLTTGTLSLGSVALYRMITLFLGPGEYIRDRSLPPLFLVFGIGVSACWLASKRPTLGKAAATFLLITALGLASASFRLANLKQDVVFGLASGILLYVFAVRDSWGRAVSIRPLAWVGTFAYSLYLTHAPLLQVMYVVSKRTKPVDSFGTSMIFGMGSSLVCVLAAYLFYLACERPFFKMRHFLRNLHAVRLT